MPGHPNELAGHRLINYFSAKTGRFFEWVYARGDERVVLDDPGNIAFNDSEAMYIAAIAGLGVVQLAEVMAREAMKRGRLVQVLHDWELESLPLYVMYPQNRHLSAKVRAFAEWVAEMYEERRSQILQLPPAGQGAADIASPARTAVRSR